MRRPRAVLPLLLAPALLLAACAQPIGGPGSAGDVVPGGGRPGPVAAPGEVRGQGTVLQEDGEDARFCLGAIAESFPPQCAGPVLHGWEWPDDGMSETASGVTWGAYAVTGTWDGEAFTRTQPPIPLALYDPMKSDPDPRLDPANAGTLGDAELARIQEEVQGWTDLTVLMTSVENGYVWATVYYDDGTIQATADELYGPDVVVIVSALTDVG